MLFLAQLYERKSTCCLRTSSCRMYGQIYQKCCRAGMTMLSGEEGCRKDRKQYA